ncbi:hypothetical protein [Parvularcula dongshanensis]|uniref:MobA-like NTP transferase domain-containing protein n=1 Tax=Parvularcula dongshanensis TaxID=1173995 RepID=A0A840I189_9PROT|nr:hypothetical protein [Parvularcula dongshanensis]MBB4658115.1 hypothetical protein [Parvularcula dongshanensis]
MTRGKLDRSRLGVGILCRRGCTGLEEALRSLSDGGVFGLAGEATVLFQGRCPDGPPLAEQYGLAWCSAAKKGTTVQGLRRLAEGMQSDLLLLLGQDAYLLCQPEAVAEQIGAAGELLLSGRAQTVRLGLRSPADLGPRRCIAYERFWGAGPLAPLRRAVHPIQARKAAGAAVFLHDCADRRHRGLIDRADDGTYLVSSACLPWTSRSVMVRRDFLLERILPELGRSWLGRRRSEWEGRAWRRSGWRVGVPAGLFV